MIKYVFSSLRRKKSLHIYKNNIIIARKVTTIDERPQCSRIQQQLVCNTFSTFAGIKLWVYGMQRRHWRKRDSVSGNCCQVKKKEEKSLISLLLQLRLLLQEPSADLPVPLLCYRRMLQLKVDTREEALVLHKDPPQKKRSGCCWAEKSVVTVVKR